MKKQKVMKPEQMIGIDDDDRAILIRKQKIRISNYDPQKISNYQIDKRKTLVELVSILGISKKYINKNIEISFDFSISRERKNISESIFRQHPIEWQGKLLSCFENVITNAVLIETHKDYYINTKREDKRLDRVYVLLSAFQDENSIYPVELLVKQLVDRNGKLYMAITIAKIKKLDLPSAFAEGIPDVIIVEELIKYVNDGFFLKYVPNKMLSDKQIQQKEKAISIERNKIEKLKL